MEREDIIEVYLNEQSYEEQVKVPMLDYKMNNEGDYKYVTTIYEQPNTIGINILNFLQNNLKDTAYFIFRFYGFKTLLTEKEQNEIYALDPNKPDELNSKIEELYNKYKKELESYKKQIIDIIEYCLFNNKKELNNLNPIERLQIFINTHSIEKYTILKYNEFKKVIKINKDISTKTEKELIQKMKNKDNYRYGVKEIYEIDNYYKLLFLELYFILQGKIYLKKCKNCGKYFLTNNSAVIYCNNIYEDNKSCREIGASKVFTKNLEKDEAYSLYRKVYKKKQALAKSKGGKYEIEYNVFKNQGKDKKNAYKLKEITKKEFINWINKQ